MSYLPDSPDYLALPKAGLFICNFDTSLTQVLELSTELDDYRQSVPDLEDKIVGLQAETDSQDKALREAEERYEKLQRQNADYQLQIKQNEQELEDLQADLSDERKKRKGYRSMIIRNILVDKPWFITILSTTSTVILQNS